MITNLTVLFNEDRTLSEEGLRYFREQERAIRRAETRLAAAETDLAAAEAKLAAIAAVTGPTGGATIDAEARTAIDAIIAGAT